MPKITVKYSLAFINRAKVYGSLAKVRLVQHKEKKLLWAIKSSEKRRLFQNAGEEPASSKSKRNETEHVKQVDERPF